MCGICGIVSLNAQHSVDEQLLASMNATLQHRGPDDSGCYVTPMVGLAMRRLSIIDLSTGKQPIGNEDGSVWVVFNGEIYNFRRLRQQLEKKGHAFKTETDTEVIVHAYEEYGDDCVHHFNGMFAFALWDNAHRRLLIARDRLGIKPLYYHASAERLAFASELKALIADPTVPREIDLQALDHFLTLEYIPTPRTIFSQVHKLPPGHRLIVENGDCQVQQYWRIPYQPVKLSEEATVARLQELIQDAVQLRMIADVPLGAFLSGGIDSSAIVAFMSEASARPVRTFSIGFENVTYNELPYARLVSQRFGTNHHEEILNPHIADTAERLVRHLDEPFADFSIFPTYLVSEVARQSVKVVLSGDGGDEIFGGYDTYVAQNLARRYERWLPAVVRRRALPMVSDLVPPHPAKKGFINKSKRFIEGAALPPALQHTRWMIFMNGADRRRLYAPDLYHALDTTGNGVEGFMSAYFAQAAERDPLAQQQYVDVNTYLVDDILTKVDRMSMAVSLEARVPLLDHRIVEFALNLPPHMKLKGNNTKILLRKAVEGLLPAEVLDKPKEGFSIPLKHWLREASALRPMMLDLLAPDTVRRRGYFDPDCVSGWVEEHLARRSNHSHRLWALMVFELWQRQVQDLPVQEVLPANA